MLWLVFCDRGERWMNGKWKYKLQMTLSGWVIATKNDSFYEKILPVMKVSILKQNELNCIFFFQESVIEKVCEPWILYRSST